MSDAKQFLCSHLVTLSSGGHRIPANLEKIWSSGVTLNAEECLPPGASVTIECPEFVLETSVVSCSLADDGHLIEANFQDGYVWSPELFQPHHFTDPDILLVRKMLAELLP